MKKTNEQIKKGVLIMSSAVCLICAVSFGLWIIGSVGRWKDAGDVVISGVMCVIYGFVLFAGWNVGKVTLIKFGLWKKR